MPASASGTRADQAHSAQPGLDPRILAAFRDALAVEVFGAVTSRAVPATGSAIAELLGVSPAEVEERLASLERWNLVERVSAEPAAEPTYRAMREALITDEEWAQLAPADRRQAFAGLLETISARIWEAVERGGFDAHDAHVSRVPADLDTEGYEDMARLGAETLERAREIQAAVVQRRAEGTADGDGIKTELVFLHFRRDGQATPPPEAIAELRESAFEASEDVTDALAGEDPDWQSLAVRARELAALAERLSAAPALADAV